MEATDTTNPNTTNPRDILEQQLLDEHPAVLKLLLKDQTRTAKGLELAKNEGRPPEKDQWNIIWGTDNYQKTDGDGFGKKDEITEAKITGEYKLLVRPRVDKAQDLQRLRAKDMAEVFTPCWVCNAQNNLIDEAWFGRPDVFNTEFIDEKGIHRWKPVEAPVFFSEPPSRQSTRSWWNYVHDPRLEITCGEAPYLVSRYDTVTGDEIPLNARIGLLDRKLRVVSENVADAKNWLKWAYKAVQATYGFEWQGDNLLLAREAVLFTVIEFYRDKFGRNPSESSLVRLAEIISWNLWQMDGLKMVLPYSCEDAKDWTGPLKCEACAAGWRRGHEGVHPKIRDWRSPGAPAIHFEEFLKD